jgi:hypothetical protein
MLKKIFDSRDGKEPLFGRTSNSMLRLKIFFVVEGKASNVEDGKKPFLGVPNVVYQH